MALKHLGPSKKAAFVSLMVEVINADGRVDVNELLKINDITEREHIDSATFALGRNFDVELALATLSQCSSAVKTEIATWLIAIAEADGMVQAAERAVLHMMFDRMGILTLPDDNNG